MLEAYEEYYEVAPSRAPRRRDRARRPPGRLAGFTQRGYHLGHVTGHSIGMTMIEHPRIGEGIETELAANMVFSMHPHAIAADGESASTCRTRGSSPRTAASRSPACDADLRLRTRACSSRLGPPWKLRTRTRRSSSRSSRARARATTSATSAPTSCSRCRRRPDEWVHRDELLFQTVHQSSELWLKHAWMEVEEATRLIEARDLAGALRLLRPRVRRGAVRRSGSSSTSS